jgi:hypothetical protein
MKIKVTQDHIDNGSIDPRACPVALAIREAGFPKACVLSVQVWLDPNQTTRSAIKLPRHTRHFIEAFDEGDHVEPFEFDLPTEATS